VLDVDATLVDAHSEKEQAAATFKHGFGFHPIGVWCDNTHELLAVMLRPGNAGSNHAGDHIEVLGRAIAQIPAQHRQHLLIRADGASATHQLLDWLAGLNQLRGRRVEYSIGFPTKNTAVSSAITRLPAKVWTPAVTADGEVREPADVVEITDLLDLSGWPDGMRVIVRREHPHPGAQLSLFETHDGYRYQAFATNTRIGQLGLLEARHCAHARVEDRIRAAKDTGLGRLPSREWGSTPPGCNSPRSPQTSSPGCSCSPWTVTSPRLSRNCCGSGCCTWLPGSPTLPDGAGSASPPAGRGRPRSLTRSSGS
jgi:hypothetical protein